jgi:hypothetical protein
MGYRAVLRPYFHGMEEACQSVKTGKEFLSNMGLWLSEKKREGHTRYTKEMETKGLTF